MGCGYPAAVAAWCAAVAVVEGAGMTVGLLSMVETVEEEEEEAEQSEAAGLHVPCPDHFSCKDRKQRQALEFSSRQ